MTFTIPSEYHERPLKVYLQVALGLSSRLIARLKATENGILLDGMPVTVRAMLHEGSTLALAIDTVNAPPSDIVATPLPLSLLYEDEHILVCNKPGDMPTHPSHGHYNDTLANALAHYERTTAPARSFVFHPINRLDRNTSGVVLIARNALAAQRLGEDMASGRIRKAYLALLCGVPPMKEGDIITGIRRRQASIIFREVCAPDTPDAARAHTRYRVLHDWQSSAPLLPPRLSLVCAQPVTGRTHQLRLHFSHLGTPILGDDMYGNGALPALMERQALHAAALHFCHPISRRDMTVCAPLPDDMRALLPSCVENSLPLVEFFNQ